MRRLLASSLAETVEMLCAAIETGFWTWNPAGGWDESEDIASPPAATVVVAGALR